MGWIAKSLNRQDNLNQFGEGVASFFKSIQERRNKKDFIEAVRMGINSMRNSFTPEKSNQVDLGGFLPGVPNLNLGDDAMKPSTPGGIDYDKAKEQSGGVISDFLNNATDKDINFEDILKGISILEAQRNSLLGNKPPEPTYQAIDSRKDIYKFQKGKKPVLEFPGVQDSKVKKDPWTKQDSYTGDDGYRYITYRNTETGETKTEKFGEKKVKQAAPPQVHVKMPESQEWKEIGDLIATIQYTTDDKGKYIERSPEEQEQVRKIVRKKSYGRLKPKARNWYKTIIEDRGNEDISTEDFETLYNASQKNWKFDAEDIQSLSDYNAYRPDLWPKLRESVVGKSSKKK